MYLSLTQLYTFIYIYTINTYTYSFFYIRLDTRNTNYRQERTRLPPFVRFLGTHQTTCTKIFYSSETVCGTEPRKIASVQISYRDLTISIHPVVLGGQGELYSQRPHKYRTSGLVVTNYWVRAPHKLDENQDKILSQEQ